MPTAHEQNWRSLAERHSLRQAAHDQNAKRAGQICVDQRIGQQVKQFPNAADLIPGEQNQDHNNDGEIDPKKAKTPTYALSRHA